VKGRDVTLSFNDPQDRHSITNIVLSIAAQTGFTTLMRIGDSPLGPFTINDPYLHEPDLDLRLLLNDAIAAERANPLGIAISACALVLPDRDIAYIKHGPAPMTTLTIGRTPVDDPYTHHVVNAGLDALMHLHGNTHLPDRPVGRTFPPASPARMPDTSPRHHPTGDSSPPAPSAHRQRPRR
jgi:hypothetical protein